MNVTCEVAHVGKLVFRCVDDDRVEGVQLVQVVVHEDRCVFEWDDAPPQQRDPGQQQCRPEPLPSDPTGLAWLSRALDLKPRLCLSYARWQSGRSESLFIGPESPAPINNDLEPSGTEPLPRYRGSPRGPHPEYAGCSGTAVARCAVVENFTPARS